MNWSRAKVVVTGGRGFLGSHLCEALVARGARVTVIDDGSFGSSDNLHPIARDIRMVSHCLGEADERLEGLLDGEVLFHLAAIADPRKCEENFDRAFRTNVGGLQAILARSQQVGRVIVLSSASVYGDPRYVPMDEDHPLGGTDAYAMTKRLGEQLCAYYRQQARMPITVIRNFNTFGPRQSRAYLIPQFIAQAMVQQRIELWNGDSVRDFLYVSDWVEAMLAIAETDQTLHQTLNLGSGRGIRVGDLAEQIGRWFQVPVVDLKRPLVGSRKLICNPARLQQATPWRSGVSFEEGLQRTMDACRGEVARAEAPRG